METMRQHAGAKWLPWGGQDNTSLLVSVLGTQVPQQTRQLVRATYHAPRAWSLALVGNVMQVPPTETGAVQFVWTVTLGLGRATVDVVLKDTIAGPGADGKYRQSFISGPLLLVPSESIQIVGAVVWTAVAAGEHDAQLTAMAAPFGGGGEAP